MNMNVIFELSMVLDHEKFDKLLNKAFQRNDHMIKDINKNHDEYIDGSMYKKGLTISYVNTQYKKKVKITINARSVLNCNDPDPNEFVKKLEKRIGEYFDYRYQIDDFTLFGMILSTDINVHNQENVTAYLKVLKRIRRVKGFSPSDYESLDDVNNFCLEGNSNCIEFLIYDLKEYMRKQYCDDIKINQIRGTLRAEVRLTKPKAIRDYTGDIEIDYQIRLLLENYLDIFMDIFTSIIPYGDFYKKGDAEKLIKNKIKDNKLMKRMIQLIDLIPEKRSLYLAQKAMNYRDIEKIMEAFVKINLSPVTISKRHDVKWLENIYEYLVY